MEGTFHISPTKQHHGNDEKCVTIGYPIMIIGAGQDKTIFHGGFKIEGTKEEGKRVGLKAMTIMRSIHTGLEAFNGLSFLCDSITFTQCGLFGVRADYTKGRLINCVITQSLWCGIHCGSNTLIELEGDQTKVDGNVTMWLSNRYGLSTNEYDDNTSIIHLLFPLTKESVSTNNGGGKNYGGGGTIQTVESFDTLA
jgi:hypothetical protein